MPVRAKLCGLRTPEVVQAAVAAGAAFVGFVFYPKSPRHVTPAQAAVLAPEHVPAVAVLVDPTDTEITDILAHFHPGFLQLHGAEMPTRVAEIRARFGVPIIKAFSVRTADDFTPVADYAPHAEYFLFDAKGEALPGGNGVAFDWNILRGKSFARPWFLSGGLNAENIAEAVRVTGATLVDVSSGIESAPGVKDIAKIHAFTKELAQTP